MLVTMRIPSPQSQIGQGMGTSTHTQDAGTPPLCLSPAKWGLNIPQEMKWRLEMYGHVSSGQLGLDSRQFSL